MLLKYIFDRLAAFFGLLLLLPILVIIALLIRVKMPGDPVLFMQKRVGLHGKLFTMVKFRTMVVSHSGSSVSVAGESRITPQGGQEQEYILDAFETNWAVPLGPNGNGFEEDLETYLAN